MRKKVFILSLTLVMLGTFLCRGEETKTKKNAPGQKQLRVLVIGAHPDDAEDAGGLAAMYINDGHKVQLVSVTNGDKGHQTLGGARLANIRRKEAACSGDVIGAEYIVMNNHDGELVPSLENRLEIIRMIRRFNPDIIFTHPPNDYHPDHRYTSILVRDATYMVMVPNVAPDVPAMDFNPVVFYLSEGGKVEPDLVIGIDEVVDEKVEMYHCHKSQVYDWLPWVGHYEDEVPEGEEARKEWIMETRGKGWANTADKYRDILVEIYGEEKAEQIEYAEAFRNCSFGGKYEKDQLHYYFPFLEKKE